MAEELDPAPVSSVMARDATPDDLALVEAALRDPHDFARLYRRYTHRVYRYALSRTGSASAADDIVDDVMLAAFEGLSRFDPARGAFAGWLFTIVCRTDTPDTAGEFGSRYPNPHPRPGGGCETRLGETRIAPS